MPNLFWDGGVACRLCCRGGGRRWWGWSSAGRLQVFYFRGGYFDGSEAVVGEVVGDDAEKVLAFGGSADLLMVLDSVGDVFLELVEGGGDVELRTEPVDESAGRIEDEDDEFKRCVDFAVGGAEERNVGRLDGVADAVTAEGTVDLFGQDVVRSGSVFDLGGGADWKDGYLHDDLGGCGRAAHHRDAEGLKRAAGLGSDGGIGYVGLPRLTVCGSGAFVRVGVVAVAVGQFDSAACQLNFDLAELSVANGIGRGIGQGIEVRAIVDGGGDGLGDAGGVEEGVAAGGLGHLAHGDVLGGDVGREFVQVINHAGSAAAGLAVVTGGGGIEGRRVGEPTGVDRVDCDLTASEQVHSLAKLFFVVGDDRKWVGEIAGGVGENADRK